MRAEYGWAAPLTEQPDQEAPPEPELWYEVDEGAGELPWTGAAEAEAWAWKQPEESPFATPELLDVQDTEAADVAAWLEDEDEKVEEEDEETAAWEAEAWEAGTSAEAGAAGQGPGLGQVTVGVAELLQLWDTAAALDQRIRHMVRQTLLQRGGLVELAMAPAVPEWELDGEEFTPRLTFCQKARLAATAEDDVQARLIEQLKLPIRSDERAKIVQRVRVLVALFEGLDPAQKARLRGRLNRPDDALARFFDCELSRGFRKRLRALLEGPPSPVPTPPVPPVGPVPPTPIPNAPPPVTPVPPPRPPDQPIVDPPVPQGPTIPIPWPKNGKLKVTELLDRARSLLGALVAAGLTVAGLAAAVAAVSSLLDKLSGLGITSSLLYDVATGELDFTNPDYNDITEQRRRHRARNSPEWGQLQDALRRLHRLSDEALDQLQQQQPTNVPPADPPVKVKPTVRGYAIEDRHLRELFLDGGYEKVPDYFKGIDAVRGPSKTVRTAKGTLRLYRNVEGVSVKSTKITDAADLLAYAKKNYIEPLQGPYDYTLSGVRVQGLKKKVLHLIFEEGAAGNITKDTVKMLEEIARLARLVKGPKIEFRWFVYLSDRRVEGAKFLKDMKLGDLEYVP